ncbi:malonyl-ACP O-methyltransferase BioC [Psychromonas aquimarina]|uniref:malonyl-ACP O-methyltransferase BioC n=1 Tax=Psychromonas aquimarina TaxID=444919 RepID=UPI000419DE8A|nr:malonyl-ACP O-methyltransferase BioC [Psychromonas aquimarina]
MNSRIITNGPLDINKQAVEASFSKAAEHYDQFAQLQRDIGLQLFKQLSADKPANILDLGCGTGYFSEKLADFYPHSSLTCFDLSSAMLEQVKQKNLVQVTCQQGDIDKQPFPKNFFDLIFSNLVVQWSADLGCCLQQLKESLTTGGKLHISTLLDGSLHELTQAWKSVDSHPHTNSFLSLAVIEELLAPLAFQSLKITTETRTLEYDNVIEVMRALKGIGANHVHGHQRLKLQGRQLINQLEQGYSPFVNDNGLLNLTYQVCYIEAVK